MIWLLICLSTYFFMEIYDINTYIYFHNFDKIIRIILFLTLPVVYAIYYLKEIYLYLRSKK